MNPSTFLYEEICMKKNIIHFTNKLGKVRISGEILLG